MNKGHLTKAMVLACGIAAAAGGFSAAAQAQDNATGAQGTDVGAGKYTVVMRYGTDSRKAWAANADSPAQCVAQLLEYSSAVKWNVTGVCLSKDFAKPSYAISCDARKTYDNGEHCKAELLNVPSLNMSKVLPR